MYSLISIRMALRCVVRFPLLAGKHKMQAASLECTNERKLIFTALNIPHAKHKGLMEPEGLAEKTRIRSFKKDVVHTVDKRGEALLRKGKQAGKLVTLGLRVGQDAVSHG